MAADLLLDGVQIGASLGEGGDEGVGVLDHQVTVEGQLGDRPQRLDHGRAEGDVGDEVAVHDVDMDDGAAAALSRGYFIGKVREVGGEDGEAEFDQRMWLLSVVTSLSLRLAGRDGCLPCKHKGHAATYVTDSRVEVACKPEVSGILPRRHRRSCRHPQRFYRRRNWNRFARERAHISNIATAIYIEAEHYGDWQFTAIYVVW